MQLPLLRCLLCFASLLLPGIAFAQGPASRAAMRHADGSPTASDAAPARNGIDSVTDSGDNASPTSQRARNVVVIVADDLGFQLGCYGNTATKTPNIDALAASGVKFTRANCTTASCSASRSVILTGLYNHATGHYGHAHGYNHFSTYESVPTLPVMMSDAGYRTCSIGKYHVAPEQVYHFDAYRNEGVQGSRNTVRMAANAKEWIAEANNEPFFLYFCPTDPHRGGGPGGFANNDDPKHYPGVKKVSFDPQALPVPNWLPDTPTVRKELAEYYEAVNRVDQGVGELLSALKELGHDDDTLILFLSDNGPPFPGAKTTLYQPGMNLPLIVRDPYFDEHGVTTDAQVNWADITPTIIDWCGITPNEHVPVKPGENDGELDGGKTQPVAFHGKSFVPALKNPNAMDFDKTFASHTFHEITTYYPMRVLVDGNDKLIFNIASGLPYPFASDLYASPTWQEALNDNALYYGKRRREDYITRPRFELYDLSTDPDELKNLANDPAHAARLKQMQQDLRDWQKKTKDPWVSKWVYE